MALIDTRMNMNWIFMGIYLYFFQGRQKLARFNAHEFATLVIDILSDAKRRQQGSSVSSPKGTVLQKIYIFLYFCLNKILNKRFLQQAKISASWVRKKLESV